MVVHDVTVELGRHWASCFGCTSQTSVAGLVTPGGGDSGRRVRLLGPRKPGQQQDKFTHTESCRAGLLSTSVNIVGSEIFRRVYSMICVGL